MVSDGLVRLAIAMWVRSDWRRRARSLVALTLLTAVAGGFVLMVLAGARRTATSFDRFARTTHAADVLVDVGSVDPEISAEIGALPMVENSTAFTIVFAIVDGIETDLSLWLPRDDRLGNEIEADRLVRGRRSVPTHPDEVVIDEATASAVGLDVGDRVSIATLTPAQLQEERYFPAEGPVLDLRVVGVIRSPDDLLSRVSGRFVASAAC